VYRAIFSESPRKRKPEEEIAARPQRIMEQWKDLSLKSRLQIDQQVAARDQIEA
jgi:hypothetical protein